MLLPFDDNLILQGPALESAPFWISDEAAVTGPQRPLKKDLAHSSMGSWSTGSWFDGLTMRFSPCAASS
jgi:hypothetical protein